MRLKRQQNQQVTIGDYQYTIRPLGAMNATYIFGDLCSIVLPIIGTAAVADGKKDEASALSMFDGVSLETDSLISALSRIDGPILTKLVTEMCLTHSNVSYYIDETNTWKPLDRDDFDEIFCMDLKGMLLLCVKVIQQNFGNFFDGLGTLFGDLTKKAPASQSKPTASLTANA